MQAFCWILILSPLFGDRVAGASEELSGNLLPFGKAVRERYFQFANGTVYFNHGGFGATPRLVRQAMEKYSDEMEAQPTKWYAAGGYRSVINTVRTRLAAFLKADAKDLVFLDNASGGMNAVLQRYLEGCRQVVEVFSGT
eukprot:TRINITY_DN14948_c0_g1_i4.p1 TRINITY_DN14948_c0_g1~~TRINITY_DN14948_c0_g1_i4.p1  ORF type:complete len:140 (-),score=26.33 TRINITY_DN14948_c0_g1_i4:42-461(-)